MEFSFTPDVKREFQKIKRKEPLLFEKMRKQLRRFQQNPRHPSLRTHKLKGNLANTWSISVTEQVRMVYFIEDDHAVFFHFGTHDEVYKS